METKIIAAPERGAGADSVTVVACSCGAANAYENNPTGSIRRPAKDLIGIFRHFHEKHGTVTVKSQNVAISDREENEHE